MPILITEGAKMQCTLGSGPATIKVTSQDFKKINNSVLATDADKEGIVNIPSFGSCSRVWYKPACVPSPQAWQKTAEATAIQGNKKLTKDSFCMCSYGGKISFTDTGSNEHVSNK
ncbi:MAG: DUF4280 domain-containing protein [Prevotella sp.]|jgi:hypothetical protein|nr:DUF4280 domain-containing protein [Prevotella sp.]